jgi:hypothetical protein
MEADPKVVESSVKLDLVAAREYLASNLADRVRSGHEGRQERWNGKTDRELLTRYLMAHAIVDDASKQESAVVKLKYKQSELGERLERARVLGPTRRYAGPPDPFSLPSELNDILTNRYYENWDDSKAYPRYMRAFTQIPEVRGILDELLTRPTELCVDICRHYFGSDEEVSADEQGDEEDGAHEQGDEEVSADEQDGGSDEEDRADEQGDEEVSADEQDGGSDEEVSADEQGDEEVRADEQGDGSDEAVSTQQDDKLGATKPHLKQVKRLLHSLSMDGTVKAWRKRNGIADQKQDHWFVKRYSELMPLVTEEMQMLQTAASGMQIIKDFNKEVGATKRPELQWKSYVLQSIEISAQTEKKLALSRHGLEVGSLEHDGIKQLKSETGPALAQLQQELSAAASRGVAAAVRALRGASGDDARVLIPVEPKSEPPVDPRKVGCRNSSFAYCSELEPSLIVLFRPETEEQRKNAQRWLLAVLNRFFVVPTKGMKGTVIQLEYHPWTDTVKDWEITTPVKLQQTFPGFFVSVTEKRQQPLFAWWLEHDKRRTHRALGFYPQPGSCPRGDLNTFGGLAFDHLPREAVDMNLVQPVLLHYMHIFAAGNPTHCQYQLDWTAACLQWRKKLDVAMILYGAMGGGKDVIVGDAGLFSLMWGAHFLKSNDLDMFIDARFNSDQECKLMVCGDEVTPHCNKRNVDKLKDVITGKRQRLERKNVDPIHIDDHRNFVFTTNNPDSFRFDQGERRQYMVEIADTYSKLAVQRGEKTDEEVLRYFANVLGARYGPHEPARKATQEETMEVAKHFYWYLMDRDLSGFLPTEFPTSALRDQQMAENADNLCEFFMAWEEGSLPNDEENMRIWNVDCQSAWRIKFIREAFAKYLQDLGLPPDNRSGKHMTHQLESVRFRQWIRPRPSQQRHPLGRAWLLRGHQDFERI